jgi:hypothetical protein
VFPVKPEASGRSPLSLRLRRLAGFIARCGQTIASLALTGRDPAMNTHEKCLRSLIEKWLSPTPAVAVRVIRASCTRSNCRRYVRVETLGPRGLFAMFFFQHEDGSWQVFPPELQRPAIGAYQYAA